jgi:hypothetical protein
LSAARISSIVRASGLLPSPAVNSFVMSSRDRWSASVTSSLMRCCTAVELPSEKTVSSCLARSSETVRARSPNSASTLFETFSNSVLTNSALAPVSSRSSTRAPISSASVATVSGSTASAISRASVSSATTRPSMSTRSP